LDRLFAFEQDLGDKAAILVTMEVAEEFGARIRKDSVARVTGRGVLGDQGDRRCRCVAQPKRNTERRRAADRTSGEHLRRS